MIAARIASEENRRIWSAGEPSRADARLRVFGRRVGGAVLCRRCDGQQYTIRVRGLHDPVKCTRCGGEGLEP